MVQRFDQALVNDGRLLRISTAEGVRDLAIQKRGSATARHAVKVRMEVVDLILDLNLLLSYYD